MRVESVVGLRISTTDANERLKVDLTPASEPADQVVESEDKRVFIEANGARRLAHPSASVTGARSIGTGESLANG